MALEMMVQQRIFKIFTRRKSERKVQIKCTLCNLEFFLKHVMNEKS